MPEKKKILNYYQRGEKSCVFYSDFPLTRVTHLITGKILVLDDLRYEKSWSPFTFKNEGS